MLTELGKKRLTELLLHIYGKINFTEEDLTEKFWTDLYNYGSDFFRTPEGYINLDFFWSEHVRDWILADKSEWIKGRTITIE